MICLTRQCEHCFLPKVAPTLEATQSFRLTSLPWVLYRQGLPLGFFACKECPLLWAHRRSANHQATLRLYHNFLAPTNWKGKLAFCVGEHGASFQILNLGTLERVGAKADGPRCTLVS